MALSTFIILFVVGLVLAYLAAREGLKWVVLGLAALLLAAAIGAGMAVEQVSPETFAKFPFSGATIAQGAAWLAFLFAGAALGAALKISLGLLLGSRRKGQEGEDAAASANPVNSAE